MLEDEGVAGAVGDFPAARSADRETLSVVASSHMTQRISQRLKTASGSMTVFATSP
jgi:hypothetical protein